MIIKNWMLNQIKISNILLLLFMVPFCSYTGEFKTVTSYSTQGVPIKKLVYIWDVEEFPIKVCIDSQLSKDFQFSISSAVGGWNQAWSYILGRMLERNEIERNQIGVDVPPWEILDAVFSCTKEKSDQAAEGRLPHIFVTSGKLPANDLGRQGDEIYKLSSSGKEYLYKSVIELNEDIDFYFKDFDVPVGKLRLSTVVRHELGHALGLPHNTDFGTLMYFSGNRCRGKGRNECNIKIKDGIHFANLYGYFMDYTDEDLVYKSKCRTVKEGSQTILICYD